MLIASAHLAPLSALPVSATGWRRSWRADPRGRVLADRHYSRQKVGHAQFVAPGRCVVLLTDRADALWVSAAPLAQYVKHAWAGAWQCSLFRNEAPDRWLSSRLVREAVAVTLGIWGEAPVLGMVTFVDATKTRHKRDPGRCFKKAGFRVVGRTKEEGLIALQMLPSEMPMAVSLPTEQESLF